MKAEDVMTHCVVSITPTAPIADAISRMISHQVSGMPVIDERGGLVGMVTEGDLLRRTEIRTEAPRGRWIELLLGAGSRADDYARSHGTTVEEVMSRDVVSVGKATPLAEVVRLMDEHAIKRVPVVDAGQVVGIVSRADLMVALAERLRESKSEAASDESIRDRILREMRRQTWCPLHALTVTVRKGIVDLKGEIFDERQRRAIHVLVENAGGVKAIHDHLTLVAPIGAAGRGSSQIAAAK